MLLLVCQRCAVHIRRCLSRLRRGPKNFESIFTWAEELLTVLRDYRVAKGLAATMDSLVDVEIAVTTSYSGMGTAELAWPFIQRAFRKHGHATSRAG